MKKILVTGGAGFIGSHLVNNLINSGHKVYVVDNLRTGKLSNINPKAEFFKFDLVDNSSYKVLPKKIDLVFHLAAQVSNEASYIDPLLDLNANSLSSLNLLEWSKKNSIKKFIFTSTMGVYKDNLGFPAEEDALLEPKGFYGINKRSIEQYIKIYSEVGLNASILRLFNVYGPGQNMQDTMQGMLSIYMNFIWNKKRIEIKGSLERERDFIYVDDVVDALNKVGFSNKKYEIYNVCTGKKTTVKESISLMLKAFDEDENYPITILERTPRDIDSIYGSNKNINKDYNWTPKVNLKDGIGKMVAWLLLKDDKIKK
mgnify:CR=1 FL=1|jgi:UDP-glucose 4-epimerase